MHEFIRCLHEIGNDVGGGHDAPDRMQEITRVPWVFKGIRAHQHDVQGDPKRPHVGRPALVGLLLEDFRRNVGRSAHRGFWGGVH